MQRFLLDNDNFIGPAFQTLSVSLGRLVLPGV